MASPASRVFTLTEIQGPFAICRLPAGTPVPTRLLDRLAPLPFVSITRTNDELSIVLPESSADPAWRIDPGWGLMKVEGPFAFDVVGVIASLSAPLADAGLPVFVISTFDTDYLLVKTERLEEAQSVLRSCGHRIRSAGEEAT